MNRRVASSYPLAYLDTMAARLMHLLAFLAVLTMPFGMAAAPAMVPEPAATTEGHCSGHDMPAEAPAQMADHCATCSALPAISLPAPGDGAMPREAVAAIALPAFTGIVPEIATPPPKHS